jgi:hypothetical protein
VDFLMSGEDEVLEAITALAAQGYKGVQLKVDADTHWLSVTEGPAPETETAIFGIVFRVDPRAVKI